MALSASFPCAAKLKTVASQSWTQLIDFPGDAVDSAIDHARNSKDATYDGTCTSEEVQY